MRMPVASVERRPAESGVRFGYALQPTRLEVPPMNDWLHDIFRDRPWWMNALMVFSAWMAFVYMPWDIFWKPVAEDQEVWFGLLFTGFGAKILAFPHWFVYAAGVYGLRRRRPWMPLWGALYCGQVSFGMFIWSVLHIGGFLGFLAGIVSAVPFALLAWAFLGSREHFESRPHTVRERYGDWALVTGASAGIGAEFARALAREGLSVVLTARREERLRSLGDELEKSFNVAVRVVPIDLAAPDGPDRLVDAVADLEIGVLVNNAGAGYAGRFDKQDPRRLSELVALNCAAPTLLTNRLLSGPSGMVARGRGAVIFTGSAAAHQPMPLHGVYAATKAYDLFLGEALFIELRRLGIDVLVLEPGATATEFQEVAGEVSHPGEDPAVVVRTAIESLGLQPSVLPGWLNWLRANAASRLAPRPLTAYVARGYVESRTPSEMQ